MANGSGLRIGLDDLDSILPNVLHPNIAPHFAPPYTPSPMRPITPGPLDTSGAPDLGGGNPAPAGLNAAPPMDIAKPTRQESNAAGKAEFRAGKPTVDAEPGSSDYFRQNLAQEDYAKQHPWGSPISEHPGFLGKVGHVLGRVGNIAGDILDPNAMTLIPGTDLHNAALRRGNESGLERAEQAETSQENADTAREGVEQKPDIEELKGEIRGQQTAQKDNDTAARQQKQIDAQAERDKAHYDQMDQRQKDQFDQQLKMEQDKEKNENARFQQHEANETTRANIKGSKPTPDEQRRADLAENLNENLNTLEAIAQKRPELFGPLAGRWAELKQKFGSDDPDLGTLQTIEHQIGMSQISAHGMRSAQGVQAAADSILNHMHSGPQALLASINAARNSVKTFQGDVDRAKGGGGQQENEPQRPAGVPPDAKWNPQTRHWEK